MRYLTHEPEQTELLGEKLAMRLRPGDIIAFYGDLGAGKTAFVSGVTKALGSDDRVQSPTYTIVNEYHKGKIPVYHFDVYRISDPWEMDDLGYEEYFYGDGVCLVEWGNLIEELMPENTIYITIEKDLEKGFDYRKITVSKDFD